MCTADMGTTGLVQCLLWSYMGGFMLRNRNAFEAPALRSCLVAFALAVLLSLGMVAGVGCSASGTGDMSSASAPSSQPAAPQSSGTTNAQDSDDVSNGKAAPGSSARLAEPTTWDESASPDYYRVVGPAVCDYPAAEGVAVYAGLDRLSRAGSVYAIVTYSMMEGGLARDRADMSDLHPSGWYKNEQVAIEMPNGSTYNGYFYNRSHLLAKSLGGEESLENIITGTRTQNVGANDQTRTPGGMAYAETKARNWLEAHPEGMVYYAVTPLYMGDELVARSVVVDILSSDGSIDEEIEVYNCAKGYVIDYATGDFSSDGSAPSANAGSRESEEAGSASGSTGGGECDYVLNTNTHKFHYPDCSSVGDMNPKNKLEVHASRDEVIAQGYVPCKRCNP